MAADPFLRITLACNQKCLFCNTATSVSQLHDREPLVLAALDRLAAELPPESTTVAISGGEPTIHKRFFEYLEAAVARGFRRFIVETNAMTFAEPAFAGRLRAIAGTIDFFVSLHSHRDEVNDALTGCPGGTERTLAGIRRLIAGGHGVRLNFVGCRPNIPELAAYVDFVAAALPGVQGITFSFVSPVGRAAEHPELVPPISWAAPYYREALVRCRAHGIHAQVPDRCGFPPCFLPGDEEAHVGSQWIGRPRDLGCDRRKAPGCRTCVFDVGCLGVWTFYADRLGTAELAPVTALPPALRSR